MGRISDAYRTGERDDYAAQAGQPLGAPVEAAASGEDWKIMVGNQVTTWYQIMVLR
jgi:hypothetical protein